MTNLTKQTPKNRLGLEIGRYSIPPLSTPHSIPLPCRKSKYPTNKIEIPLLTKHTYSPLLGEEHADGVLSTVLYGSLLRQTHRRLTH